MQHNLTPEKSKLKTSYKKADQYSLKMSGHKRPKKKKKEPDKLSQIRGY